MAEGNGDSAANDTEMVDVKDEPMEQSTHQHTEDYQKLLDYGLAEKVANRLDEIYVKGKLAHADLDVRALDALKEFSVDGALEVLQEFYESNLEHVSNKSAFLCGVMKAWRQKSKQPTPAATAPAPVAAKGPNEDKIKLILERTGYSLDVTTGQRKYGGPPPDGNKDSPPGNGCEIFVGKIPKDMFEDELIPLFEKCGKIWDLRLMMDPLTPGQNRGYAFITYCERSGAIEAVKQLDNYEIRKTKNLKVNVSVPNMRLFVGNIPKSRSKEEIYEEFVKLADGLIEVIIYSSPNENKKNRGFCFLEYDSHKAASAAKRKLGAGRIKVWGCDIIVDWADPQEEPDQEIMSKVKVLYVRNLTSNVSEEQLKDTFEAYGKVDRVKKIKDYAFVHFEDRDNAIHAMEDVNGREIGGSALEVSLAKPPSDKKKKEEQLRARERRMMGFMHQRQGMVMVPQSARGGGSRGGGGGGGGVGGGGGGGGLRGPVARDYDYDYDYYGYGDYRGGYGADPYYDDPYYRYDDYYDYGYGPGPRARGRGGPDRARGRGGPVLRGRVGGPPIRGRGIMPAARGVRGVRGVGRGGAAPPVVGVRGRGSLAGSTVQGTTTGMMNGFTEDGEQEQRQQDNPPSPLPSLGQQNLLEMAA